MSEKESPEISKSWIIVNDDDLSATDSYPKDESKKPLEELCAESDTDSISIISESGSSFQSRSDGEESATKEIANNLSSLGNQYKELTCNKKEVIEEIQGNDIIVSEERLVKVTRQQTNSSINIFYVLLSSVLVLVFAMLFDHYLHSIAVVEFAVDNDFTSVKEKFDPFFVHKNQIDKNDDIKDKSDKTKPININKCVKNNLINRFQKEETKRRKASDYINENSLKKMEQLKAKEEYLIQKEKFLIEKEHKILEKEMQFKMKQEKRQRHKVQYLRNDKIKTKRQQPKDDKNKNYEQTKQYSKFEHNYGKYNKNNMIENYPRSVEKHSIYRTDFKNGDKYNASGYWYFNLSRGRSNIRKQENASNWLFDKARFRNMKRKKPNWYFQWMLNREKLRFK